MTFAERLKTLRREQGFTQVTLAEALGVSKGTVAMWETGKRNPDFDMINKMTDIFDRRMDYILGYSDDDSSPKLTEEEINQLGVWAVEDDCRKIMKDYMSLDDFGKAAVENLIQMEKLRCMNQQTIIKAEGK